MRRKTLTIAGTAVAGLLALTGLQASAQASEFGPVAVRYFDQDWRHQRLFFDYFRFIHRHDRDHDRRWW